MGYSRLSNRDERESPFKNIEMSLVTTVTTKRIVVVAILILVSGITLSYSSPYFYLVMSKLDIPIA